MTSVASASFWKCHESLPAAIRVAADNQYALFRDNPNHPPLHFEHLHGELWSARVNNQYRDLAYRDGDPVNWFWIGTHAEYDRLIG